MAKKNPPDYKPLSFGTTVRNPERYKDLLPALVKYNNKVLTDDLITDIMGDLIRDGAYTPKYVSRSDALKEKIKNNTISDGEIKEIMDNTSVSHQEAGFKKGWPSRFDTYFRLAKELGFVYYEPEKPIIFSEAGKILADAKRAEAESSVFLNAFVKYRRNNPFRRVLNNNSPLILLLETIKKLNNDSGYNDTGIYRGEIPILLCWRDDDADALYEKIKEVREKYRYKPSNEVILDICDELTYGRKNSNKDYTILTEYPDDFIRKMKLTGLISIRGRGDFIDINKNEKSKIDYVLKEYKNISSPNEEKAYFDFISQIDDKLIDINSKSTSKKATFNYLKKWAETYTWDIVKKELRVLANPNSSSQDEILKYISEPLRLEFLTSLAIVNKYPEYIVNPNYIIDDEGFPSSHAPGNRPDIECIKNNDNSAVIIEVTLLRGTIQHKNEAYPVPRHLDEYKKDKNENTIAIFIAPQIFVDTKRNFKFVLKEEGLDVRPIEIKVFVDNCDKNQELEKMQGQF